MTCRALLTMLVALAATPLAALSCMPTDAVLTYKTEIVPSETRYTLVIGRMSYDEAAVPAMDFDNQAATPEETRVPARLTGLSIQKNGFTGTFDAPVDLVIRCSGPWCPGGPGQDGDLMIFLNVDDSPPSVTMTACGGHAFALQPGLETTMQACFEGGPCASPLEN